MKVQDSQEIQYQTPAKLQKRVSTANHHYNHDNQCVCQICTCKKHKCPPKGLEYAPDILKSTMKNDYQGYNINPEDPVKRSSKKPYKPTNYDPDLLKTTAQQTYQAFTPQQVQKQPNNERKEDQIKIPFNGESTYKNAYQGGNNPISINPQSVKQVKEKPYIPFSATSTYKDNFGTGKPQSYGNDLPITSQQKQSTPAVNLPFNGQSSYKQEYQKYNLPSGNNENKQQKKVYQSVPFQGQSSYKDDFKKFGTDQYKKEKCIIYDYPERPQQCSPGKNHLYYHAEQNNWD